MFVGWIRNNSLESDLEKLSLSISIDKNLILKTIEENHSLCFAAYEKDDLLGIITAYDFDNSILVNNLCYLSKNKEDIVKKLLDLFLKNINDKNKTVLFLANKHEQDIFKTAGFNKYANFQKAIHSSGTVAFNFSNTTAKSISGDNFLPIIKELDSKTFHEDRLNYITHILSKQSSLVQSTPFGYQHSYAIGKSYIKISPWVMKDEAFMDAEKLIRGLIYHRGLKTLISFIPKDVKEITELYTSYGFELKETYTLLYLNEEPNINLESIYGF